MPTIYTYNKPNTNYKGLKDRVLMCIIFINAILLWPKRKHTKIGSHEPLQLLFVKSMQEIYEMNVLGFLTCILCPNK